MQIIQNLKQKFKHREPQENDFTNSQIKQTLQNPEDTPGTFERDKFGRKILKTKIKSVKTIIPDPPTPKVKTDEELKDGKKSIFSVSYTHLTLPTTPYV